MPLGAVIILGEVQSMYLRIVGSLQKVVVWKVNYSYVYPQGALDEISLDEAHGALYGISAKG